ncbi:hypothetical protein B6U93_00505 [Candidatus Woesearchaeota archaeon ex4484_78]|nr:MAG: hypothetical protein B6U93_00505 [Candidatus Woesearchaeota archaeon ex4484_78]
MKPKIVLSILILFFVLSFVNAAELDYAETRAIMDKDSVNIISEFKIISDKDEIILFEIPEDVKKVNINIRDVWKDCQIIKINKTKKADCGKVSKGRFITLINFTTRKPIEDLGKQKMFKFEDKLPFKARDYSFVLELPTGYIIPKKENKIDFFLSPNPDETSSDGQRISITWKDRLVQKYSVLAITQPLVDQKSQSIFTFVVAIAIIILIAVAVSFYILKQKNKQKKTVSVSKPKKKKKKEVVPELIESEQKIVDLLKNSPNKELWQKQLLNETNFSKAKLSRIIRNLESRGVVSKTIYGNTNKIALIEK